VEEVDAEAFGRDVEFVIFAEELCAAACEAAEADGGAAAVGGREG